MQELAKIDKPSQAIVLYKITPKEIAERLKEYDQLKVIEADTKSYKKVRSALTSIITTRVEVDKRRKQLGEDARKLVSNINQAAKMLIEPMTPYEDRFKSELNTEDDRKVEIKAAKDVIEQARVDKIRSRINDLQNTLIELPSMDMEEMLAIKESLELMEISVVDYMEFTEEAVALKERLDNAVTMSIESVKAREAEEARIEKIWIEQEAAQKKINEANQKLKEKEAALEKIDWERVEKIRIVKEMEEERIKVEKEQEIETEMIKKEIIKQNRLMPDKEKLLGFIDTLGDTPIPRVETKEAGDLLNQIVMRLTKLVLGAKTRANKL